MNPTVTHTPHARSGRTLLHPSAGPLIFCAVAFLPVDRPPYAVRCGLGLLWWMAFWWLTRPVHLAVTGLLPLVVVSLLGFVPIADILPSYADELIILLVGANILTAAWSRWKLERRIALMSLATVGSSARRQMAAWFIVSTLLATLLPRVVVAATMVPSLPILAHQLGCPRRLVELASRQKLRHHRLDVQHRRPVDGIESRDP